MTTDPIKRKALAMSLAVAVAMPAEGLRRVAYYDPPGILTVCYGSTTDVVKGKVYSDGECRARLDKDMTAAINDVERCAPGLPPHVLAAFGDAVYNLGPRLVCDTKISTAARKLREGDVVGACNELPKWDKARVAGFMVSLPGLTKRRAQEQHLCLTGEVVL